MLHPSASGSTSATTQAPAPEELAAVVELANRDVLGDDQVKTTETTLAEAEAEGAMAFFGDKYGDVVRMVRAGPHSLEFCGGTHVHTLGQIGPISLLSEGSIGANTRRIFAVTGEVALQRTLAGNASSTKWRGSSAPSPRASSRRWSG